MTSRQGQQDLSWIGPGDQAPRRIIPGLLLRRAHQVLVALWSEKVSNEITSPQYAVLGALAIAPHSDQVTIARLASLDRSTLADVLARLAAKGLVKRSRDGKDGRRNVVSLTPAGEALYEKTTPLVEEVHRLLLAGLSEEQRRQFLLLLARMVKASEAVVEGLPSTDESPLPRRQ